MTFFKNKLAVTIIVLSVGFLILIGVSVKRENISGVENGVGSSLNVVQRVLYSASNSVKNTFSFIFNFTQVKNENQELKQRNAELENKMVQYDIISKENEDLKAKLDFKNQRNEYNYIGCNVIGVSGGNFLDGFIVDRGTKDGLKKGMAVVTDKGLVGQVTSTSSNWSIIQSISNENIAVSGMVESTNEINGIIRGYKDDDNKLLAKLYSLPLDSTIKVDDVIITSGHGNLYPKGIRIGKVIAVEDDKGRIMKNAIIEPFEDFNKLDQVLVVVPKETREIKY